MGEERNKQIFFKKGNTREAIGECTDLADSTLSEFINSRMPSDLVLERFERDIREGSSGEIKLVKGPVCCLVVFIQCGGIWGVVHPRSRRCCGHVW